LVIFGSSLVQTKVVRLSGRQSGTQWQKRLSPTRGPDLRFLVHSESRRRARKVSQDDIFLLTTFWSAFQKRRAPPRVLAIRALKAFEETRTPRGSAASFDAAKAPWKGSHGTKKHRAIEKYVFFKRIPFAFR
jgi:hypothetical protein